MGNARYIYFDNRNNEFLNSITNKSELINRLLKEHIAATKFEGLTEEELRVELEIVKLQEETDAKIKELKHGG